MRIWHKNCRDTSSLPSLEGTPFGKICVLGYAECFDVRNRACDCQCIVKAIFSCSAVYAGNPKGYLINHSICEPGWFFWMQLDLIDYWSTRCQAFSYVFVTSPCCLKLGLDSYSDLLSVRCCSSVAFSSAVSGKLSQLSLLCCFIRNFVTSSPVSVSARRCCSLLPENV